MTIDINTFNNCISLKTIIIKKNIKPFDLNLYPPIDNTKVDIDIVVYDNIQNWISKQISFFSQVRFITYNDFLLYKKLKTKFNISRELFKPRR